MSEKQKELKAKHAFDVYEEYTKTGDDELAQVYLKEDVDEAISELKAENERLKKCEIWMKQHFYCEEVIACESAKNRRLKRALWLARAERAKEFRYKIGFAISSMNTKYDYSDADKWQNVERKCLKKAEQYK